MIAILFTLAIQPFLLAQDDSTITPPVETTTGSPNGEDDDTNSGSSDDTTDPAIEDPVQDISCETAGNTLTLSPTLPNKVRCPANCELDTRIWGTKQYTDDSSICIAAIHDGQLTQEGGEVSVYQGQQSQVFIGSSQNQVTSLMWGAWGGSFQFDANSPSVAPRELSCTTNLASLGAASNEPGVMVEVLCPAGCTNRTVWGTSIYTNDSSICTAAVHSGALPVEGGSIGVFASPGLSSYTGSEQNGVTTLNWRAWPSSFVFAHVFTPNDAKLLACETSAQSLGAGEGSRVNVYCPPGCVQGPEVLGFEVYSDDSSVCRAAIHAGILGSRGGSATIEIQSWVESLASVTQHGITSRSWGEWYRTFAFVSSPDAI